MSPRAARLAFGVALSVHLLVLYLPRAPSPDTGLPLDTLVHVVIFALVAWTGVRAGLPARPLVLALLVHAAASELIQHHLLPGRSGDWRDAVADAAGVGLALAIRRRPVADPADAAPEARR